jgi:hypothetical protein
MMGIEDKLNELRIEDQSNEWSTGDKLNVLSICKNWTHTGEHGHLMMVVVVKVGGAFTVGVVGGDGGT